MWRMCLTKKAEQDLEGFNGGSPETLFSGGLHRAHSNRASQRIPPPLLHAGSFGQR